MMVRRDVVSALSAGRWSVERLDDDVLDRALDILRVLV